MNETTHVWLSDVPKELADEYEQTKDGRKILALMEERINKVGASLDANVEALTETALEYNVIVNRACKKYEELVPQMLERTQGAWDKFDDDISALYDKLIKVERRLDEVNARLDETIGKMQATSNTIDQYDLRRVESIIDIATTIDRMPGSTRSVFNSIVQSMTKEQAA